MLDTIETNSAQTAQSLSLEAVLSWPISERQARGAIHTPTEIAQQASTWRSTFEKIKSLEEYLSVFLTKSGVGGENPDNLRVVLIGAGTSDFIGRALTGILSKKWKCSVEAIPSTDLMTEMDALMASQVPDIKHLWISFSRSGDSFEGVNVLKNAQKKYPEIRHLIVTCNDKGQMATPPISDEANTCCVTLDGNVNDLGLAMTSSFTNMIVAGLALAHIFDLDAFEPIVNILSNTAEAKLIEIAELAERVSRLDVDRICFLGSGPLKSVGAESGLKVMELTAGHYSVMSESFLGLRHGPLSWLNKNSLVVAFVSSDPDKRPIELGLLAELKRKNAVAGIVAIFPHDGIAADFVDHKLALDLPSALDDNYRPPIDVLFAQCLGLTASLRRGLSPDTPSVDGKIQRVVTDIDLLVSSDTK